ncbi:MAG: hypothetical protein KA314_22090 [Chloroflexi bacterium]|nr:hypothetical protein [Chloroflexota bacterium]MBP8058533.1 hypothetical protein [Chloroflexota bacterium]
MPDVDSMIFGSMGLGLVITCGSLLFTGAIIFFVYRMVYGKINQSNKLLTTGVPAQARVLQLADTGVRLNDNPQVKLVLEVHPMGQPPYQVETTAFVSMLKLAQIQPGQTVNVRYDPADQSKVALALM